MRTGGTHSILYINTLFSSILISQTTSRSLPEIALEATYGAFLSKKDHADLSWRKLCPSSKKEFSALMSRSEVQPFARAKLVKLTVGVRRNENMPYHTYMSYPKLRWSRAVYIPNPSHPKIQSKP